MEVIRRCRRSVTTADFFNNWNETQNERNRMFELFKKTVFAGIGAAVTTKERVESMLQEMVEQGKMTRDEAERMAEKIAADGKDEFEKTKKEIRDNFTRMFAKDKVVKEEDFKRLELRVSILEEKEAARDLGEVSKQKASEGQGPTPPPSAAI